MIMELAKHIENLLLENDCVIIPGFGGFIVQYIPARRIDEENLFLPPYRTVGFNPQLNLNDGLLIQSYMQVYDVNYPEASRLVDDAVNELLVQLSGKGEVTIAGVGKLILNIENTVEFSPNEDGVFSPSFYGLSSFEMLELENETAVLEPFIEKVAENKRKHNTLVIRINKTWLNNAVAVAAAVLLFFFLSTPVDNTYVEPENYASFSGVGLFEHIRSQSVATSLVKVSEPDKLVSKPVTVKVRHQQVAMPEKQEMPNVAPKKELMNASENKEVKEAKDASGKASPIVSEDSEQKNIHIEVLNTPKAAPVKQVHYHIIVASVMNTTDAEKTIHYFAEKGYPGGTVVKGDNRVRVAISSFTDRKAADAKWADLRKIELFQNAWILTSRDN